MVHYRLTHSLETVMLVGGAPGTKQKNTDGRKISAYPPYHNKRRDIKLKTSFVVNHLKQFSY